MTLDRSNTLPDDQSLGTVSKVSPEHLEAMRNEASPKKDARLNGNRSVEVKNAQVRPISRLGYARNQPVQDTELRASPPKETKAAAKPVGPAAQRQRNPSPQPGMKPTQHQPQPMTQKPPSSRRQEQPISTIEKDNSAALVIPQAKTVKPQPMAIVKNETNGKKSEQDFPRLWNNSKS